MGNKSRSSTVYSPPPGYDGNAFSDDLNVKLHEPNADATIPRKVLENAIEETNSQSLDGDGIIETIAIPESADDERYTDESCAAVDEVEDGEKSKPAGSLESLLCNLRGRLGREELIIILVMILVASEGFSAELIILALLLAVG